MARQIVYFQVTAQGETFNFVERTPGEKGRDILAIKLALGQIQSYRQVENASPSDYSIGTNWFDCETGNEVPTMLAASFDEKMKSKLITYQMNNQLSIIMYYFEKFLSVASNTKEDLLAQIYQVESVFESELGNIGEATIACMLGWAPNCDLATEGFHSETSPTMQIPMYIYQMIKDGVMSVPNSVAEIFDQSENPEEHQSFLSNFDRYYNSKYDLANRVNQEVGFAVYKIPEPESILYSAAMQVAPLLARQETYIGGILSRSDANLLMQKALEPDYLQDPDPFQVGLDKIGYFHRTSYTLENLPPLLEAEQIATIRSNALAEILTIYSKTLEGLSPQQIDSMITFIELRTPSLRPGDVYRAYLEIEKSTLDKLLPAPTSQPSFNIASAIQRKITSNIQNLQTSYCAYGADPNDSDGAIQYQKYRAYASKRKKEIIRELRSAAQAQNDLSVDVGSGITADLGPFGQIDMSDTELLSSVANMGIAAIGGFDPTKQAKGTDLTGSVGKSYQLWETHLNQMTQNFKKSSEDLEKYELLGDSTFSVDEEASIIAEILPGLDAIINDSAEFQEVARKLRRPISSVLTDVTWFGTAGVNIVIHFDTGADATKSIITKIEAKLDLEGPNQTIVLWQGDRSKLSNALKRPRTVHYLRNINDLVNTFQGICVDDAGTTSGIGASYILKHTLDVTAGSQEEFYNPIHNALEPATEEVKRLSEQINNSDQNRPNPLNDFFARSSAAEVLPLIGPKCNWELINDEFIQVVRLDSLLCRYLKCLGIPAVNMKLPNFTLPDLPKLPTFKGFGMDMKYILRLMKEVLQRVACRFVKNIIDILKTPLCLDNGIEDLHGAGSNVAAPALNQALSDGLVDIGIPADLFDEASKMIDDVSKILTPRELCALLQNQPLPQSAMKAIQRMVSARPGLDEYINTDRTISNFFDSLGAFLDPSFCDDLNTISDNLARYGCDTVTTQLQQLRNRILKNDLVTDQEIEQAIAISESDFRSKFKSYQALGDSEGIKALFPEVIYQPGNPNALISEFPAPVLDLGKSMAELVFEAPAMSYASGLKNYVPSLFLSMPATAEPGDPNYDSQATMEVERASWNLMRYSRIIAAASGSTPPKSTTTGMEEFKSRLETLYTDYVKDDLTLSDGTKFEVYRKERELGFNSISVNAAGVELRTTDDVLIIDLDEMLPIPLQQTVGKEIAITKVNYKSLEELTRGAFGVEAAERELAEEGELVDVEITRRTEVIASALEAKIYERLSEIQVIITNNIDKAFKITDKSKFLGVLKEFYDVALENSREGTTNELIDFNERENALTLRQPENLDFSTYVALIDNKSSDNKLPYTVNVGDSYFLASNEVFTYCDEIPPDLLNYDQDISGDELPRRRAFAELYMNNLVSLSEKYLSFSNVGLDIAAQYGIISEGDNSFKKDILYNPVYSRTVEGVVEQMRNYISNSRFMNDSDYIERMRNMLESKPMYTQSGTCVRNKFSLLGKGEMSFSKLIVGDFEEELKREFGRDSINVLNIDPSKPSPTHYAISNIAVRGFVRLCILELILKGALTLSVWDIEYLLENQFFNDYVKRYIELEMSRNIVFAANRMQLDETLTRITGAKNRFQALENLIKTELATFVRLSKSIFDHDPSKDYSNWYLDSLPHLDVTSELAAGYRSLFDRQWRSTVSAENFPVSNTNNFAHLERYVRVKGPLVLASEVSSNQIEAAQELIGPIIDKTRGTSFDRQDQVSLSDYLESDQEIKERLEDDIPYEELMSPSEFKETIDKLLSPNEELQRFLSDFFYQVGPQHTRKQYLWGKPLAVKSFPFRAIRRKRKTVKFTSIRDDITDSSYNYSRYHPCSVMPEDTLFDRAGEANAEDFMRNYEVSEEPDRFYLIPEDLIDAEDKQLFAATGADEPDLLEFLDRNAAGGGRFFQKNHVLGRGKSKFFPEPGNQDVGKNVGERIAHGYTLPRRRMPGNKPKNRDGNNNMYDLLAKRAPWMKRTKEDAILRDQPGDVEGRLQPDVLFLNNYGEVTEDVFNAFLELQNNPDSGVNIKEEVWEEKVIEMTGNNAPIFNKPGESYDPLLGYPLEGEDGRFVKSLFEYFPDNYAYSFSQDENRSFEGGARATVGSNYTFCFLGHFGVSREGQPPTKTGQPKLAGTFGYQAHPDDVVSPDNPLGGPENYSDSNFLRGTMAYNGVFDIRKVQGEWKVNTGKILHRNDYKVPVRILTTTTYMADSPTDSSTFVKVLPPKILDFSRDSTSQKRLEYLRKAWMNNIMNYTESINNIYDKLWENSSDERPAMPTPKERYQHVVNNVANFPMWNRIPTPANRDETNNTRYQFLSISKLYSAAAQLEAEERTGNFSDDPADLDRIFATDRGLLVKEYPYNPLGQTPSHVAAAGQSDPNQYYIDAFERAYFKRINGGYPDNDTEHTDIERRHANQNYRQSHYSDYGRAVKNIGTGQTDYILQARALANVMTWYNARRSDGFWGYTYNVEAYNDVDEELFSQTPANVKLSISQNDIPITTKPFSNARVVHQLPIQESFLTTGTSMFYRDERTYDWNAMIMITEDVINKFQNSFQGENASGVPRYGIDLEEMFDYFPSNAGQDRGTHWGGVYGKYRDGELPDIKSGVIKLLIQKITRVDTLREFAKKQHRQLQRLFGTRYFENREYQEQFKGMHNATATDLGTFFTQLGEDVGLLEVTETGDLPFSKALTRMISDLQFDISDVVTHVRANPELLTPEYITQQMSAREPIGDDTRPPFWRSMYGIVYYRPTTRNISSESYRHEARSGGHLYAVAPPQGNDLKDFYNLKNGIEKVGLFSKVPGSTNLTVLERTNGWAQGLYENLKSYRAAAAIVSSNYLAALGPGTEDFPGLNVFGDIMDILASHASTDSEGNRISINVIRNSEIYCGIRLVHNTNPKSMTPEKWSDQYLTKLREFGDLSQFQTEERLGLMDAYGDPSGPQGGYIFSNQMASYEAKIESFSCWSQGDDFFDVFYSMDDFMKQTLTETKEFHVFSKLCFPDKLYASVMTAHGTSMLAGYNSMPNVLVPTRNVLASVFGLMTTGTSYEDKLERKFGNVIKASELRNLIDDSIGSTGLDDCFTAPDMEQWLEMIKEMIWEMIKKFPSLVLRGIADQLDPAYKDIKQHWLSCQLDGFAWVGDMDDGRVITYNSVGDKVPLGIKNPGPNGNYAPVNVAFPIDMIVSLGELLMFNHRPMVRTVDKLISYIIGGNLPLVDPNYAFQIPCQGVDVKPSEKWNRALSKFAIGNNGRYGQPVSLFTLLALATPVLSDDRRQKMECVYEDQGLEPPRNLPECDEEDE